MATEKKADKERSVEERLKDLYQLQTLYSEIDRIKILRGELPNEVKDLEDEIIRYETRINKFKDEIDGLKQFINQKKGDIEDRRAKIAKYDEQTKFAFLEKEKEFENLEIELNEKNIRDAQVKIDRKSEEIAHTEEELADNRHILDEKRKELDEIVSETKQQEEEYRIKAKEIEELIDDYTLAAFKRIRKNARNGLGIVTVQRNACGGCFNRIPPQRQLEIKMRKKIIVCEYCGRIMMDPALAGIEEPKPETPAKKTRAVRKDTKTRKA